MSKRSRPPEEPRPCPEGTYDARLDAAAVVFGDLSYCETAAIGTLDESRPVGTALGGPLFGRGRLPDGSALELHAAVPQIPHRVVAGARSSLMADLFSVNGADRRTQEGSRTFVWGGRIPAEARIRAGGPVDLSTQVAADESLIVEFGSIWHPRARSS